MMRWSRRAQETEPETETEEQYRNYAGRSMEIPQTRILECTIALKMALKLSVSRTSSPDGQTGKWSNGPTNRRTEGPADRQTSRSSAYESLEVITQPYHDDEAPVEAGGRRRRRRRRHGRR